MNVKVCTKCGLRKPLSVFHKDASHCKLCAEEEKGRARVTGVRE